VDIFFTLNCQGDRSIDNKALLDHNEMGVIVLPRNARKISSTGIYHVVMRGINRQTIFEENEDYERFIKVLEKYKEVSEYELYAYCLMENHMHFLIKEGKDSLATIIRPISSSYVIWYNKKYGRIGHLFQDRFKSEPVQDDCYFLTVLRYIFQNPVKAKMIDCIDKYPWSNYRDYTRRVKPSRADFVLKMFHHNEAKAIESFIEYINQENDDSCLDTVSKIKNNDKEAREIIKKVSRLENIKELSNIERVNRDIILQKLKKDYFLSVRQIERLTGINRGIVLKA
jgi:putative transposase